MNGDVIYHQQVSYCGKPRCRKCREGVGHGPYWYAYRTENGRTIRTYIGKQLPPDVRAAQNGSIEHIPAEADSTIIRIHVLGQFQMERKQRNGWQPVTEASWQHQRVRSLFACLLSNSSHRMGREQVMDALWPELDFVSANGRLDKSVHSLRQLLEPSLDRPAGSRLLRIERDGLVLADSALIWVDADAFEHLLAQASASSDAGEKEQLLEEAAALYGGDFLPEEQQADWASARREMLQRAWMGLLLELADLRIARGALFNAIEPLDRLLAADPASEAAVQRLMVSLAQLDRRGEALQAYTRFAAALKRAYNIAPLPETAQLYATVKRGDIPVLATSTTQQGPQAGNNGQNGKNSNQLPSLSQRPIVRTPFGRIHQNPLIGRDSEFEVLQRLLHETEQSSHTAASSRKKYSILTLETWKQPQCAVLVGEAGIGKTRLAEELGREAQQKGWTIAWSRVYAQESSVPYRQWTEVLRNAITHGLLSKQEISRQPLIFQPLSSLLPELHDILPQVIRPDSLSPEQEQLRLWEAVLTLLVTISERTPLLIVLDDFHWADSSSCELFAYLTRRLHGHAIALVGTYRDNELPSHHLLRSVLTDLQREQAIVHLPLQPLTKEEIGSLVKHLPQPVVQHIQNQAGGNPFFAEELARGLATDQNSATNGIHEILQLPDTIAAVLELRMGRLTQPCQRLLSNAAVLGGSFEFTTIARMEASGSSIVGATNEDTVLDLIEEAIQAGVISEEGTGTRINYHFWHPLLASHLYDKLSAARRASLHRRAAAVLQHTYRNREEEGAATITHHLVEGGSDPQTIIHFAELAGNHAYALSAYPEAERYYRIAVRYIEEQQEQQQSGETEPDSAQLAYLWEKLGECARYQGNYQEARELYEKVLKERESHMGSLSSNEKHYEIQIDALLWVEIGWTWYSIGDLTLAQECCNHGEKLLRDAGIETGPAWGNVRFQQSYIFWQEGKYDEAQQMAQAALELYNEKPTLYILSESSNGQLTAIKRTLTGDPVNIGRTHALLGAIANSLGKPTEALTHLNTALAIYEQYNRQREIANVSCNIGDIHLRKAEHESAQSFFRKSLYLAEHVGDIPLISIIYCNLGEIAARIGILQEATISFNQGIRLAEQIQDQIYMNVLYVDLALVSKDQFNFTDTKDYILKALKIGRKIDNPVCVALALAALGEFRIAQARSTEVRNNDKARLLPRAEKALKRIAGVEELDVETRLKCQLALAQIAFLQHTGNAKEITEDIADDARNHELIWVYIAAQRLLGTILAAEKNQEQASAYFEQALQLYKQHGMRLEYARTMYNYGEMLLKNNSAKSERYSEGIHNLQEAKQIFSECHAAFDLQQVETLLTTLQHRNVKSK